VAATNWDVVVVTEDEGAYYWTVADPIPAEVFAVSGAAAVATAGQVTTMAVVLPQDVTAANAVAAAVGNYYPNGCATATANQNVVTFNLNNCTGPLGLTASSGTVTATINTGNNQVQIQLAGNGVTANGATINLSTTGTVTVGANGQKTLQANSQTNGTGPNGNSAAHVGSYTLVWPTGNGCGTMNGQFSGVGTGAYSGTTTQINNWVVCAGRCPQSGTTTSSFNGGSVTLTFNGSNTAQCTSTAGLSASVPLRCGG
jgi:hypothetical protein